MLLHFKIDMFLSNRTKNYAIDKFIYYFSPWKALFTSKFISFVIMSIRIIYIV